MPRRICVVGAGRWGANHIRTLVELGHHVGVVDLDASALKRASAAHPGVAVYEHLDAALESGGFEAFTVATPATSHVKVASCILEAGLPVLVEKPLATTAADARRLAELARARGAHLMVGHLMLFHPAIARIRELLSEGKIGKLQYLYSNRLNLGAVRTEENILWSFAPHDVSIFQHLIGRIPTRVESRGGAFLQPGVHDTTLTVLEYPENVVGHIFVSWLHPFKEHRLVVIGSKGMLSYEDSSEQRQLLFYEKGIDWVRGEPVKREGPTEVIDYEDTLPLSNELSYFADRIDAGGIEVGHADEAVEVLEILERASATLEGGRDDGGVLAADFFVHESSFVDAGVEIGADTKIWHFSHVQSGAHIGRGCRIGQNVVVGERVRIGDHVKIQNNVSVYEGVELEDYVFCGPSMVFTNVSDPRSKYPQRGSEHYRPTRVCEGASLGANCTVVCGNTIGRHAFVAAGAVVTKDVADYALVRGVPARPVGWACECGEVLPDFEREIVCPRCARGYVLEKEGLQPVER